MSLTREQIRHGCMTDLFFLGKLLGYNLDERVHGPICGFFVHKKPGTALTKQDPIKQRLLLYPRGHFKTTLDMIDCIQWILVEPNVRILLMSGTLELTERMIHEIKSHFTGNGPLRTYFPEFCAPLGAELGLRDSFTSPARTRTWVREPTVSTSTAESIKAGSHYDVIKVDDLVNEVNSQTKDQIEKTIQSFHYTTPLLDPGGYRDVIGTRYDYSDLYGTILDGDNKSWLILQRPCWQVMDDGKKDLLFPERFCTDQDLDSSKLNLDQVQRENPYLFNCQYLNNPVPTDTQHFTPQLIMQRTIPDAQIPRGLRYFITWDLGYSNKEVADWSVGAVGGYDSQGRLFVIDLVRGRYTPSQLVDVIIGSYQKWGLIRRIGIEASAGAPLLQAAIDMKARNLRTYLPVDWLKVKNFKGSKLERISSLEGLLQAGKLWFRAGLTNYESMLMEMTRFPKYKNDDIPDAISMLLNYRTMMDYDFEPAEVEFAHAKVYGDGELGCGIVG